jgi:hypothetical protein
MMGKKPAAQVKEYARQISFRTRNEEKTFALSTANYAWPTSFLAIARMTWFYIKFKLLELDDKKQAQRIC